MLSPQSQQAIDTLLAGSRLGAGDGAVGPLDTAAQALLGVLVNHRDTLQSTAGESQANTLRKLFLEEAEGGDLRTRPCTAPSSSVQREPAAAPLWRLHKVSCQSIRGLAPYGQRFEFDFAGKSNLIYGPNGSGKSSLVAAVAWVLLGVPVTDADDPHTHHTASIRATSNAGKGSKKIDWPVMAALPSTADAAQAAPVYWSQIELHDASGSRALHLRRDETGQLQWSADDQAWDPCGDLAEFGVSPLDLQLSLIAPTAFGRRTLEACEGTRDVLSLMLGYDDLEHLGEFVSKASGNCTRLHGREEADIVRRKNELRKVAVELPGMLPEQHPLRTELEALAELPDATPDQIEEVGKKTKAAVEAAQTSLAEILGIETGDEDPPAKLDEKLIHAVATIEQGIWNCFPSVADQRPEAALPARESQPPEQQLEEVESTLSQFVATAKERIAKRYKWWEKETAPDSRVGLLLKAAQHYDPAQKKCPVCEQSVSGQPVEAELEQLRSVDPEFVKEAETLFSGLVQELQDLLPPVLMMMAEATPAERLQKDWKRVRDAVGADLASISSKYDQPMRKLISDLAPLEESPPDLLPASAKKAFVELAERLTERITKTYRGLAVLRWSQARLQEVEKRLRAIVTDAEGDPPSLLAVLSRGKEAAAGLSPLRRVHAQLRSLFKERKSIDVAGKDLAALGRLREALDSLKDLRKYARGEVEKVFTRIEKATLGNWELLYGEMATGLGPGGLELGTGRNKTIEAVLTRENDYRVPSQHFANAGLRRAVALAFYFALLDEHPKGLSFVLMDDPILSLDDEHRERWSDAILEQWLQQIQIVLATHQGEYVLRCGQTFVSERRVNLNPRDRPAPVTWQPLDCLVRAEQLMQADWQAVPNVLRQHVEEVLWTLEAYSPTPFTDPRSLTGSLKGYRKLKASNPVAGGSHDHIADTLLSPAVQRVVDEGSHRGGAASLSHALVRDCLNQLKKLDGRLRTEFDRLEKTRRHSRRAYKMAMIEPALALDVAAIRAAPLALSLIGRAAAKSDSYAIDEGANPTVLRFTGVAAVLVAGDSLEPVASRGQWVLLADASTVPEDGDLVAVQAADGQRYLRRAWSDGDRWMLHAINPVRSVPAVTVPKESPLQVVVGALYEPVREPSANQTGTHEWQPHAGFAFDLLDQNRLIRVEGDSLNPVARRGQFVVVASSPFTRADEIAPGTLAAVDTTDPDTGQVIKCVYAEGDKWILTSRNPVETISPLVVPAKEVVSVWPVRGVLFERAVAEEDGEGPLEALASAADEAS